MIRALDIAADFLVAEQRVITMVVTFTDSVETRCGTASAMLLVVASVVRRVAGVMLRPFMVAVAADVLRAAVVVSSMAAAVEDSNTVEEAAANLTVVAVVGNRTAAVEDIANVG